MKKIITFAILSFLIIFSGLLYVAALKAQNEDYVPGQILVKFRQGTSGEEIDGQLKSKGAKVVGKIEALDVLVLRVPESAEDKILAAFSKNPKVEYAEKDYLAAAFLVPDDTYFSNQWGLENIVNDADIDAPTAWDTTLGSGIKVAILDTGVSENHLDLSSKIMDKKDFTGSSSGYNDIYGHGTHVAGIVGAITNNKMGVAGGCPNCILMNGKVLNDSASGAYSWVANGIVWAADNGAKVINMSLGGTAKSRTLESAVNYAWNNAVVVAAAGNSGNLSKIYPAAYAKVIAVAATDNQDKKALFSSYGAKWVDVAAPGVSIYSTWNDGTSSHDPQPFCDSTGCYKYASGTSMATPMTAAVAALIWSTPTYGTSAASVRDRLEKTADKIPGTGTYWSAGRVNAANAVAPVMP